MFYTSAYIFLTDTFSVGDSTWLAHYEWMPPLFVSLSSRDLLYDGYLAKNNNAYERAMKYKIIFRVLKFIYSGQVAIFLCQLYRCPTTHGHSLPRFMSDSSRIIAHNRSNWIVPISRLPPESSVPSISKSPDVTISRIFGNLLNRQFLHTSLVDGTRRRRSYELFISPRVSLQILAKILSENRA